MFSMFPAACCVKNRSGQVGVGVWGESWHGRSVRRLEQLLKGELVVGMDQGDRCGSGWIPDAFQRIS